jgi:hypothetical protein
MSTNLLRPSLNDNAPFTFQTQPINKDAVSQEFRNQLDQLSSPANEIDKDTRDLLVMLWICRVLEQQLPQQGRFVFFTL